MDKKKPEFTNAEIDNILYSGIQNSHHLKVRQKTYLRRLAKLFYIVLFNKNKKTRQNTSVLNYLPKSYVDIESIANISLKNSFDFEIKEKKVKTLAIIELYLILAFLFNYKPFQKKLLQIGSRRAKQFIECNRVEMLLCGHPTILMTFIGFYMRQLFKEVVTLQHGIYNLRRYKVLWFEKNIATKVIVYGKYYRELYISQGVNERNVIIGNPYFKSFLNEKNNNSEPVAFKRKKAVFIGQQFYKVNDSLYDPYNNFIKELKKYFDDRGIEFYYKPHPRETIDKSLNQENISSFNIFNEPNLARFFNDFDIYFSVNSSLLIETYLQKNFCFQVKLENWDTDFDRFGDYLGIPLVSSISDLNNELNKSYNFYYDHNYINLVAKPKAAIVDIIMGILSANRENTVDNIKTAT